MNKAFLQFSVLLIAFAAMWFGLSRINFVKNMHLDNLGKRAEKKLGDLVMESIEAQDDIVGADSAANVLNKIKEKLLANNPDIPKDIQIHLVENDEINAFALPGNHIVVYTALIKHCDSVEELCGVLSHEMAHITLHHISKKLAAELGAGTISAATGGNTVVISKILKILSSTAFDRSQESDADAQGERYLESAHINPHGISSFMMKIAEIHKDEPEALEWISTHPDSRKRAEALEKMIGKQQKSYDTVLDAKDWMTLKHASE